MQISIFKCVTASKPQETDFETVVDMMRNSQELRRMTDKYRSYMDNGYINSLKELKIGSFPACAPCALLFEGKARNNVIGSTGLCLLDIDHIERGRIQSIMKMLCQDKHVVFAATSVSGEGLHILVKYSVKEWKRPPQRTEMRPRGMQRLYKKVFDCITDKYESELGLKTDRQAGHMERLLIVSYDPKAYYNPAAEPIFIDSQSQPATIKSDIS